MANIGMVTFDCTNAREAASWWAQRLNGVLIDEYGGEFCMVHIEGATRLAFQNVPDPTPGKNRLHLDLEATVEEGGREGAVASFVENGAVRVEDHGEPDGFMWTILQDPEGNVFCVSDPHQ